MASDFDDIFGDLKEDEQFSASLPSDFDEASIFGDALSSSNSKLEAVSKPAADASAAQPRPTPALELEAHAAVTPAPATAVAAATAGTSSASPVATTPGNAPWEQTGNSAQDDDFLSWLDDGGAPSESPVPASVSAPDAVTATMDDISLDPPSSTSAVDAAALRHSEVSSASPAGSSVEAASPAAVESPVETKAPPSASSIAYAAPPTAIPIHVAGSAAPLGDSAQTISLDDDDDDDDFLEKIVQNANRKAAGGSRESSGSSLHIKSQGGTLQRAPAFDFDAVSKTFLTTGVLPPASRLAFWCHALGAGDVKGSISMYALQTTPLDLPNQVVLRKEVESLCASIFASKLYLETIEATAAADDTADGARLLFIDNAEILLTHVCKKLALGEYPPGLACTFAPLITTGGNDPLQLELVATLLAVCHRVLPHLPKHVTAHAVAVARRPLLKWLLLYHAPEVAFHLDQHFHTWHLAAPESGNKPQQSQRGSGALLDSWVASMFECEGARDFDFLMKVWDCCVLADSVGGATHPSAPATPHASICMCFIIVHLIASRAGKKLLRMEGDQLRHCMAQTLVDALKEVPGAQLTLDVKRLIAATPPGFCSKLRDVGYAPPPAPSVVAESAGATPLEPLSKRTSANNLGMSLISASATGVKELSSAMIDMPTKLLAMGLSSKGGGGAAAASGVAKDDANSAKSTPLFEHLSEVGDSASVAMRLAARDVIPSVFEGFQASSSSSPAGDSRIRYFIVDCRSEDELRGGRVPTAFHFDPDAVTEPHVLERVLATLNPMKGKVHLCVMGHGYGHLVNEIRQQQQQQRAAGATGAPPALQSPFELQDDLFEAYAANLTRVNSALLFLTKQGFPYVSVLDGGYAAAHSELFHSTKLTVDDLIDHDTPRCAFCQHHRCMGAATGSAAAGGASAVTPASGAAGEASTTSTASEQKQESFSRSSTASSRGNSSAAMAQTQAPKTASGHLNAKSLFDAHAAGAGNSYFSSFAGALKTSGKSLMNPGDSLKDSTKWLMKKTSNSSSGAGGDAQAKALSGAGGSSLSPDAKSSGGSSDATASPAASMSSALPNFNKLRNSLVAMGSESLDLLKKAEQAAVAKTRVPFGGAILSPSSKPAGGSSSSGSGAAGVAGAGSGNASSTAGGSAGATGGASVRTGGERNTSFQRSEEEVFTIDDDDEEDDFVGGGGGGGGGSSSSSSSRTSSLSSSARNESFSGHNGSAGPSSPATVPPVHSVDKGHVGVLTKGMRVSRTQMLPCVESPFFSGYKKKKLAPSGSGGGGAAAGRVSMLPRRLVIAENHLVVLKAERNFDDVYQVKSCHSLAHIARMTCLKKNALMVTVYYKWKTPSGDVVEKRNAYEVQQRDEFIKAIKGAMEKM